MSSKLACRCCVVGTFTKGSLLMVFCKPRDTRASRILDDDGGSLTCCCSTARIELSPSYVRSADVVSSAEAALFAELSEGPARERPFKRSGADCEKANDSKTPSPGLDIAVP